MAGLAEALSTLHDLDIAHNDLNPRNILVFTDNADSPRLKIADFGHSINISVSQLVSGESNLQMYRSTGTHSAPESFSGENISFEAVDIWALGCICLEILTFVRGGSKAVEYFQTKRTTRTHRITSDMFHNMKELKPEVSAWLEDFQHAGDEFWQAARQIGVMLSAIPDKRPRAKENAESWGALRDRLPMIWSSPEKAVRMVAQIFFSASFQSPLSSQSRSSKNPPILSRKRLSILPRCLRVYSCDLIIADSNWSNIILSTFLEQNADAIMAQFESLVHTKGKPALGGWEEQEPSGQRPMDSQSSHKTETKKFDPYPAPCDFSDLGFQQAKIIADTLTGAASFHDFMNLVILEFKAYQSSNISFLLDKILQPQCMKFIHEGATTTYRVSLHCDWEIPRALDTAEPPQADFGPFLVIWGSLSNAEVATCEDYLRRRWPKVSNVVLEFLNKTHSINETLISSFEVPSEGLIADVFADATTCFATVTSQDAKTALDVISAFAWLSAAIRESPIEGPGYSDINCKINARNKQSLIRLKLCPIERIPSVDYSASCWCKLFDSVVVVKSDDDSKIQEQFCGLTVPFDLLLNLANVECLAEYKGGPVLVGYSTLLFPVSAQSNQKIQWHLEASDNEISLSRVDEFSGQRLQNVSLEKLRSLPAVLGWYPFAHVSLGTKPAMENEVGWSKAKPMGSTYEIENLRSEAKVSVSPLRILRFDVGSGKQAKPKSNRARFEKERTFTSILRQASDPITVYDTESRTAWLVPKLSVILHMAHRFKSKWGVDPDLPCAKATYLGGEAAKEAIRSASDKIFDVGDYEDDKQPKRLQDYVRSRWVVLTTATSISVDDSGVDLETQSQYELRGFEFMDIAGPHEEFSRKHWSLEKSAGPWPKLLPSDKTKIQPVLFCAKLGQAIEAAINEDCYLDESCRIVPPNRDYLVCTIDSLQRILEMMGQTDLKGEIVANRYWDCPAGMDPFQGCNHPGLDNGSTWEQWHLQQLRKSPSATNGERRPILKAIPKEGVIVFGKLKPKRIWHLKGNKNSPGMGLSVSRTGHHPSSLFNLPNLPLDEWGQDEAAERTQAEQRSSTHHPLSTTAAMSTQNTEHLSSNQYAVQSQGNQDILRQPPEVQ